MTGCPKPVPVITNDRHVECHYVPKPTKPYTDKKIGNYILNQGRMIGVCMGLLGH